MTKYLIILGAIVLTSCSKSNEANTSVELPEKLDYDTTAIDSFAPGATPANMATKIIVVKDSAAEAKKKELETQIKDLEKKKKEEEKKKTDEKEKAKKTVSDKAKEKSKEESSQTLSPAPPTAN
ncbi:hypothetical protein [Soonwooa sp.]|uniref:hypothetical protein n=1 Tax=Soonwooa sp. TaxID=1938592 RepID=UPI0028A5E10A|nr:hypothetical protein [Soonwooa sp.]